ncbi:hypothetical protein DMH25_04530 [Streptomyces sp. WAC 01325]|nr:hypothetical protein DMH25_04530 [Streptomyces sp. WAC 01325]
MAEHGWLKSRRRRGKVVRTSIAAVEKQGFAAPGAGGEEAGPAYQRPRAFSNCFFVIEDRP